MNLQGGVWTVNNDDLNERLAAEQRRRADLYPELVKALEWAMSMVQISKCTDAGINMWRKCQMLLAKCEGRRMNQTATDAELAQLKADRDYFITMERARLDNAPDSPYPARMYEGAARFRRTAALIQRAIDALETK